MGLTISDELRRALTACGCEALDLVRKGAYGAVLSLQKRDASSSCTEDARTDSSPRTSTRYHIVEVSVEPHVVATPMARDEVLLQRLIDNLVQRFSAPRGTDTDIVDLARRVADRDLTLRARLPA